MRFRPRLVPALFAGLALLILLGLGTWQVYRGEQKAVLLEAIAAATAQPPIDLPPNPQIDGAALRFRPVKVTGTFDHAREFHLFAHTIGGDSGWQVITPLQRPDGSWILVNRGWVPEEMKDASLRPEGQVSGPVTITGLVQVPWQQGWFVPDSDPVRNLYFFGDLATMQATFGQPVAPVFVEADKSPNPGGLPVGGQTKIRIPNDHAQYAITWYGLALGLVVMFYLASRKPE
ncbi:SURF1 family protein [Zavarzinia sp. CC-PAN008]|uniref:SURF1 family protein n=1 Tax=Zavarzinia sp. CC-PAN008 TaxID=3243332 RepID=UPI003F7478A2